MSQPQPAKDMYAALRQAIRENDDRDAKAAKLLRDRARAKLERDTAAAYRGPDWQGVQGELDWTMELFFIDREEASLP